MRGAVILASLGLSACAEAVGYAVEVLEGQAARAHPCVRLTEMPPTDPREFATVDAECMAAVAEARAQMMRRER